jgi:1-deoxyxylulose-5-phosphate synthase
VTLWSPLARGRLARPWPEEPQTERAKNDNFAQRLFTKTVGIDKPVIDRLTEVAQARRQPPSQIALAWLLHKPAITRRL